MNKNILKLFLKAPSRRFFAVVLDCAAGGVVYFVYIAMCGGAPRGGE